MRNFVLGLLLIFIGYLMGRAAAGRPVRCCTRRRRFAPLANEDVGPYLNNFRDNSATGEEALEGALIFLLIEFYESVCKIS